MKSKSKTKARKTIHVLLDLDETLIHSIDEEEYTEHKAAVDSITLPVKVFENVYYMYERPGLQDFLDFLFENKFKVSVWTAADKDYCSFVIQNFILTSDKPDRRLEYIFFRDHTGESELVHKMHKGIELLSKTYNLQPFQRKNNVIVKLIDDKPEVKEGQPLNVYTIKPFELRGTSETALQDFQIDTGLNDIKEKLYSLKIRHGV